MRTAIVAALLLLAPLAARAAPSCTVSATPVAFGVFVTGQIDSAGTITITCTGTGPVDYTVALSTGGSGRYGTRGMANNSHPLHYNLYADPARSQVWGDGTGGSAVASGSFAAETGGVSLTVYGRVPLQGYPAPGFYLDTLFVTLTY